MEVSFVADDRGTYDRIMSSAAEEFLAKGFQKSSLRNIVKRAGVTTGAFYGYFASKEELFSALAAPADEFMAQYRSVQESFAQQPPEAQRENLGVTSSAWLMSMIDFLYENRTAFLLVLTCAEGTRYAGFMDEMVRIEVDATHRFYEVLRSLGTEVPFIDPDLEHVIVSGMFASYFELIIHDLPREKSRDYVRQMYLFQAAGWSRLMGVADIAGADRLFSAQ